MINNVPMANQFLLFQAQDMVTRCLEPQNILNCTIQYTETPE